VFQSTNSRTFIGVLYSMTATAEQSTVQMSRQCSSPVFAQYADYNNARDAIVLAGFKPQAPDESADCHPDNVGEWNVETCGDFPEIDACSGQFPGYCKMLFENDHGDVLEITTEMGAPILREKGESEAYVTWGNISCSLFDSD
jgi:hypothetical protein